ncbi:MAG TPA: FUSC family protein [Jatrophihabitantaceae bacterium]
MRRIRTWLAAHDPGWYAAHRAVRAAVVVPAVFALGSVVIADAQLATFGAFGSFALLLFVDFPGSPGSRLAAYLMLGVTGVVLISLGTLASRVSWLAVAAMAIAAFAVLFAGVISSVIAAAGRAALLTFILAVMLPGRPRDIPPRLAGWAMAMAFAIPVALLVWPTTHQNQLRKRTAEACRALAAMLHPEQPRPGGGDSLVAVMKAVDALRAAFRASASRPVALSTGSRLLMRVVDELEWLTTVVVNACADAPEQWPEAGLRLRMACADVLVSCAHTLDGSGAGRMDELPDSLAQLEQRRAEVADATLDALTTATQASLVQARPAHLSAVAGDLDRPLYAAHQLGYAVDLTGRTTAVIGAADARTWFARLAGRRPSGAMTGELAAAEQIAAGHLASHSVWLQNSLRGAAGLAGAVLIARVSGAQHGFWVVLGALSVLRSNALSTGATVLRALAGTVAGFVFGALLLAAIGTDHAVLWPLLPVVVLIAAFTPDAISFLAGQAAFTVVVIILFNIIAPEGWTIGLLRVEDVAFGCAASLAAGLLFWPRGAAAALGQAMSDGYRSAAAYLLDSVRYAAGYGGRPFTAHQRARAAAWRLDDALRQYLAERGSKHVALEKVTTLTNGAGRLRLAGEAIARMQQGENSAAADGLDAPARLLANRADDVTGWYQTLAGVLSGDATDVPPVGSPVRTGGDDESFLDVLIPSVRGCGDAQRARDAQRLLWSAQYLGDVNLLRGELVEPAAEVRTARRRPLWVR